MSFWGWGAPCGCWGGQYSRVHWCTLAQGFANGCWVHWAPREGLRACNSGCAQTHPLCQHNRAGKPGNRRPALTHREGWSLYIRADVWRHHIELSAGPKSPAAGALGPFCSVLRAPHGCISAWLVQRKMQAACKGVGALGALCSLLSLLRPSQSWFRGAIAPRSFGRALSPCCEVSGVGIHELNTI